MTHQAHTSVQNHVSCLALSQHQNDSLDLTKLLLFRRFFSGHCTWLFISNILLYPIDPLPFYFNHLPSTTTPAWSWSWRSHKVIPESVLSIIQFNSIWSFELN